MTNEERQKYIEQYLHAIDQADIELAQEVVKAASEDAELWVALEKIDLFCMNELGIIGSKK